MGERGDLVKNAVFILGIIMIIVGAVSIFVGTKNTGFATSDSQVGNLSASVQTYIACTWSNSALAVDFGPSLNPGENDIEATENDALVNGTGYNVTVDPLTTSNVNISISGNDLVDGGNSIGIGNITFDSSTADADDAGMVAAGSTPVTTSAQIVQSDVASGTTAYYRFWLDVPTGTVAGSYEGNYTIQCEQA
jgi:hypothetical protein